jgi:aminoglycoside/choline kinase family phosphotransferase
VNIGLCAPKVLALEDSHRFLLLEDLGQDDLASWLAHRPDDENRLYSTAIDVLLTLAKHGPPEGLSALSPDFASVMIDPFFEWYKPRVSEALRLEVLTALQTSLAALSGEPTCLALRDFHAQNLIWRPQKAGTDRIGILDFQDAFLAAPEYDLVSLLRDARRDVSPDVFAKMIRRFAAGSGKTVDQVTSACAILGVQRNLRILGIFARLAQRDCKVHYRTLMPRVVKHLRKDLSHPELGDLSRIMSPLLQGGAI